MSLSKTPLVGRRILLIGIGFYDYEQTIAAMFRRLGADVVLEDERPPAMRNMLAPIRRKFLPISHAEHTAHLARLISTASSQGPFDDILVIKGELLDEGFLRSIRLVQPNARLISYQWDSMERFPELARRQSLFDRVLTFDQADHIRYRDFILRPTFYRPEIIEAARRPESVSPFDFCFVGWLHHDRLKQVEALRRQIQNLGMTAFFYLFTGTRTAIQLTLQGKGKDIHRRHLPFNKYAEKIAACRVIIDLPHPRQRGLTMRALEAVAAGKKMITTSQDVKLYDFYHPEQFQVIDGSRPQIDPAFIGSKTPLVPSNIVEQYSLRSWALDVLGVTTPGPFLSNPLPA